MNCRLCKVKSLTTFNFKTFNSFQKQGLTSLILIRNVAKSSF